MRFAIVAVVCLLISVAAYALVIRRKEVRSLPPANPALAQELRRDVEALCAIGQRTTFVPGSLAAAASLIEREFRAGGYAPERQEYFVAADGVTVANVIAEVRGRDHRNVVVIGAHYDAVEGTVGADDNASGVAVLLALARRFAGTKPDRTLRFVAFANEEPPHFQTPDMGSLHYARRCNERGETVVGMLSLEMLGYYSDAPRSQQYPALLAAFYPDRGNFIGFAGNRKSWRLVRRSARAFRRGTSFPAEAAVLPEIIPQIGWSDQWSFWQFGWPALMVTDTALFRNPWYHTARDTPETLDYERMAHVTTGLRAVVAELAGVDDPQR